MRETKSNGLGTDSIIFVDDVTGNPIDPATGLMMPNNDVKKEQEDTSSPIEPDDDSVDTVSDVRSDQRDDDDSAVTSEDNDATDTSDDDDSSDMTDTGEQDDGGTSSQKPDEDKEGVADTAVSTGVSENVSDEDDSVDDKTDDVADADDARGDGTSENDDVDDSDTDGIGVSEQDDVIPQSYYDYASFWYDGVPLKAIAMSCASVPASVLLYAFAPMRIMALLNGNGGIVWQCASFLVLIMLAISVLMMLASFVLGIRNVVTKKTYRLGHIKNMLVALFFTMLMLFIGTYVTSTFVTGILGGAFDIGDLFGAINSVLGMLPDTQAVLTIAVNGSFIGMCATAVIAIVSIVANIMMGEE